MYDIILFDLDGTLTESGLGIVNSIIFALERFDIHEKDIEKLKKFIGPPLAESFMRFFDFTEEDAKQAVGFCQEYLKKKGIFEAPLYNGIEALLRDLKVEGKTLYVATSKPEVFARQILEHLQVHNYFHDIVGSYIDGTGIKKDEIISAILEKNSVTNKSKVVMVGDREHDVMGARKVGIDSIGVLYGYGDYDELVAAGATHIVKTPEDVFKIIKGI